MLSILALAAQFVPSLITAVAGDKAGAAASKVTDVVRAITGTDDPVAAKAALDADPVKAMELQTKLTDLSVDLEKARLAQQVQLFQAQVSDAQSARSMGEKSGLIAAVQVGLTGVLVTLFAFIMVYSVLAGVSPPDNLIMGTLVSGIGTVIGFFFGNSTSAHAANQRLAAQASTQAAPAVATTGTVNINSPTADVAPSAPGTTADDLNTRSLAAARGNG